jgi:hypothetical protein
MTHNYKKLLLVTLALLSLLALPACSAATPTLVPTADLNTVRTEAASTVWAQVSQTAAAQPTATPTETATPLPSLTPTLDVSPGITQTAGLLTTPALTPGLPVTPITPLPTGQNLAKWVSQSIPDDSIIQAGQIFTMTVRLRNVGTLTWTPTYRLRFYANNQFSAPSEILLGQTVLPGQEVEVAIRMRAPAVPGIYRSDWVMADALRSNFKEEIFFKLIIAGAPTPTARPAITFTPTP